MTAAGTTAFVKAVGGSLNAETPALFRREIAVLRALATLPPVPYRAVLLDAYDDGDWVAVLLADVPGRPASLDDPSGADAAAVRDVVERQARELTPSPPVDGLRTLPEVVTRWRSRWADLAGAPDGILPPWMAGRIRDLNRRVASLPERLTASAAGTLCHWDVREDNVLVGPTGEPVIVDWGWPVPGRAGAMPSRWR